MIIDVFIHRVILRLTTRQWLKKKHNIHNIFLYLIQIRGSYPNLFILSLVLCIFKIQIYAILKKTQIKDGSLCTIKFKYFE